MFLHRSRSSVLSGLATDSLRKRKPVGPPPGPPAELSESEPEQEEEEEVEEEEDDEEYHPEGIIPVLFLVQNYLSLKQLFRTEFLLRICSSKNEQDLF